MHDLTVSPEPVSAGSTFKVSATVTDDNVVTHANVRFEQPNGPDTRVVSCTIPPLQPQPVVQFEATCTMADFALNGTWTVLVYAYDGEVPTYEGVGGGGATTTFEVTGGSNDQSPPEIESITYTPTSPIAGEPFTLTIRTRDEHLVSPAEGGYMGYTYVGALRKWDCEALRPGIDISPTVQEWVSTCPGVPELGPGTYNSHFVLADLNGNVLSRFDEFEMVAGE
ncbi:MAG: hypothetical protein WBA45_07685 [Microthrixaceae bacterium]